MNGEASGGEKKGNFEAESPFNIKCQYNYQPLFA